MSNVLAILLIFAALTVLVFVVFGIYFEKIADYIMKKLRERKNLI